MRAGVAAAALFALAAGQEVVQLAAHHRKQPSPEAAPLSVVVEPLAGACHRLEHFLRHVGGVGVLQAGLPREPVDQRRIDLDELPPSVLVPRITNAEQQAGPRGGWIVHATDSLRKDTGWTRGTFQD